jgi:hypothetical protein
MTRKPTLERLEDRHLLTSITSKDVIVNARTAGDFNRDGVDDILFGFDEGYLAVVWGSADLEDMDHITISKDGVTSGGEQVGISITEVAGAPNHFYNDTAVVGTFEETPPEWESNAVDYVHEFYPEMVGYVPQGPYVPEGPKGSDYIADARAFASELRTFATSSPTKSTVHRSLTLSVLHHTRTM